MADTLIHDAAVSSFGIVEALTLFGEDAHEVGAYNVMVGDLVGTLCRLSGFDTAKTIRWREAARVHDIGKLWVPANILLKRGPLDEAERRIVQEHVRFGYARLRHLCPLAAEMALSHHENHDGTGYPHALKGKEIPLSGRMVRLCDVYDALRAERPYKAALAHEDAVEILLKGDARVTPDMFDPDLLCLFALHHRQFDACFSRQGRRR
ncbi:HD domain-containing protein (plasmid) [Skermanella sp. TT6]|uniref:HD domain-containing protein n=1 Tax=Skermanella cutis TaxID=2775420 RepID=A0ABX7BE64_9PROT|nr:HD domain-containing phosphohydrolase [Skermanella sp. TT6]QQP92681.1 HD domain-containing protein [Skermanella sp. TT6]